MYGALKFLPAAGNGLNAIFILAQIEITLKVYLYLYISHFYIQETLMGEGFILLTRGYGFMGGGVPPPF